MLRICKIIIFVTLGISLLSCKKETITTHENLVADGNTPPNYNGVSTTQMKIYVNKMYVDLLGMQPSDSVLNEHAVYLKQMGLTLEARDTIIDLILLEDAYYERLFSVLSSKMLESTSRYQIEQEELTYDFVAAQLYASGDTLTAQVAEVIRDQFTFLKESDSLYKVGNITLNEFYAAFCTNAIYDEINMGSLNFAISCFENYFYRAPSGQETTNSVDMIDGQSSPLLGTDGNSKFDFIEIITGSDEFYQGLVIDNFITYLSRNPSSYEMFAESNKIRVTDDLAELKKSILRTDEYAGF